MELHKVQLGDYTVSFPFEPYNCQVEYMERVMECLTKGCNGILESPTGTGKTLCLLCVCLSWLNRQKSAMLSQIQACQPNASGSLASLTKGRRGLASSQGDKSMPMSFNLPKVIYASRTHSQLSQVIKELNKTAYRNVQICYFGSRDRLCINPDVMKEENITIKNNLCRAKTQSRQCPFFWGLNEACNLSHDRVMDIEEMVELGRKHRFCPFYKYRENSDMADLLLMPYNYVLDAKVRKANKIDLKNSVIIFDEAHNLEQVCEETSSVSLSTKDLAGCLKEAKQALQSLLAEEEELRTKMDNSKMRFGQDDGPEDNKNGADIDTKQLAHFIVLLDALEKRMDSSTLDSFAESSSSSDSTYSNTVFGGKKLNGKVLPATWLLNTLNNIGITVDMLEPISLLVEKTCAYLAQQSTSSLWQSKGVYLHKVVNFLHVVFQAGDSTMFKVFVEKDSGSDFRRGGSAKISSDSGRKAGFTYNYWCFNSSTIMQNLTREGARCVLITSGTLSPIGRTIKNLGLPIDISFENGHVIQPHQVLFRTVAKGPDRTTLSASFANRNNESYVGSLGSSLINLMRVVPDGLLIFFASYAHMESCVTFWKSSEFWAKMSQLKSLFVEPKSKDQFSSAVNAYTDAILGRNRKKDAVNSAGAVFFAVCRGKLSEGFDFSDNAARCVVIAGIPYPPLMDPRVILKQAYLTEKKSDDKFSGNDWYNTEAVRAVNQAMGRVIRHKNDFGAILLADERFTRWDDNNYPKWIRQCSLGSNDRMDDNFGKLLRDLSQFFKLNSQRQTIEEYAFGKRKREPNAAPTNLPVAPLSLDKNGDKSGDYFNVKQSLSHSRKCYKSDIGSGEGTSTSSCTNELSCESVVVKKKPKLTLVRDVKSCLKEENKSLAPQNIDKSIDFIVQVKRTLVPAQYSNFSGLCLKYRHNICEAFISEVRCILLPDFPELFSGFLSFVGNKKDQSSRIVDVHKS